MRRSPDASLASEFAVAVSGTAKLAGYEIGPLAVADDQEQTTHNKCIAAIFMSATPSKHFGSRMPLLSPRFFRKAAKVDVALLISAYCNYLSPLYRAESLHF